MYKAVLPSHSTVKHILGRGEGPTNQLITLSGEISKDIFLSLADLQLQAGDAVKIFFKLSHHNCFLLR